MSIITQNFKIIKRYFILYFREKTVFKSEAIMSFFDFLITIFSTILFWISIKGMGVKFEGWNTHNIIVMVGFNFISIAIYSIFFGFRDLEYKIVSGEFDLMMTKGQSPFFILILNNMNFLYIIMNLIMGIFVIIYSINSFDMLLSKLVLAILICVFSTLSLSNLYSVFSLLAFRLGRIYYIRELFFSFLDAKEYPTDIFPKSIYNIFTFIIPLSLISTIPTKIVFNKTDYKIYVILSFSLFIMTSALFKILSKKAIKLYSSTGN